MSADLWLSTTLRGDAELMELLTGGVHFDVAPKDTHTPFAVLTFQTSLPIQNMYADTVWDKEFWAVKLVDSSTSWAKVTQAGKRIKDLIHKRQDAQSKVIESRYERTMRLTETDEGQTFRYLILEFQIGTQEF